MSARKIGLLILILGLGAAVETTYSLRRRLDIGPAGCRVLGGRFYGNSFHFEDRSEQAVPPATRVEVENAFGPVRVRAGAPAQVKVVFSKTVYLETEDQARQFATRLVMKAERREGVLRLFTNRDELSRQDDVGFETGFDLQVPADTAVAVHNSHGGVDLADVARAEVESSYEALKVARVAGPATLKIHNGDVGASGVKGALSLHARHGDVELQDIEGRVDLDLQHGKTTAARLGSLHATLTHGDLVAEKIGGELEVRGEHTGVQASGVAGAAQVSTSFREVNLTGVGSEAKIKTEHGEVRATGVKGALWVLASFANVELTDIGGPVEVAVEHGGVRARGLEKGGRLKTEGDEVDVVGFRGPLQVETNRGDVHLVAEGPLSDPITATTRHGGIHFEVPAGSGFDLEATTRRGEIQVDVPGFSPTHSEVGRVTGRQGKGGGPVRLTTEGGDLSLTARAVTVQER